MSSLERLLEENRGALEAGVAELEVEIETLRQELEKKTKLRDAALGALGQLRPTGPRVDFPDPPDVLTLHDAMTLVLRERREEIGEDHGMTAPDLAGVVNRRGLYRMKNGSPVTVQQIHARVGNYSSLFEKKYGRIYLRD